MEAATEKAADLPIFKKYTIGRLAQVGGLKESYVATIKEGKAPVTDRCKQRMSRGLHKSEEELFGPEPAPPAEVTL